MWHLSSEVVVCWTFFVVVVLPRLVMFVFLLFLGSADTNCHFAGHSFKLSILSNLKSANLFLLDSPLPFFFFLSLLGGLLLSNLFSSFVENSLLLLLIESFKVVWLNSVGSKHGLFSSGVFSHEVMVQRVVYFDVSINLEVLFKFDFSVTFLLR
jgi:hypothetical protein